MAKTSEKHQTTLDGLGGETILTTGDLAAIFKASEVKMREMLATGKIEGGFQVGNRWRIQVKDVKIWMDSQKLPKNKELYDLRRSLVEESKGWRGKNGRKRAAR
ncbi:MAG TPA: helix-turn-helix domain-containing protein [Candidatus Cybelea sp.]